MMKTLIAVFAVLAMTACAQVSTVVGSTPEAQIANGANAHTAATTLATVLLKNDKITVAQARSFRHLLGASSETLDAANKTLVACRKSTGTSSTTRPDPCAIGVADIIGLALVGINNVQKVLDEKK